MHHTPVNIPIKEHYEFILSEELKDASENVILKYDEDSMGVYVKITDKYEFLLSKLSDDEE